jgi:hypothetical protein
LRRGAPWHWTPVPTGCTIVAYIGECLTGDPVSGEVAMIDHRRTATRSAVRSEIAGIAASAGSIEERAQSLLAPLRRAMPYAAAWIAVRDPETGVHRPVGTVGDTAPLERYFAHPAADAELQRLGLNRHQPPVQASRLPVPMAETVAWGDYLLPAGFQDGLAAALFTDDGRQVGFLCLLTDDPSQRTADYGELVGALCPLLSRALDRVPSMAALARLSGDALGAVALTRGGGRLPLAGLPEHDLLQPGSRVLDVARELLTSSSSRVSFLCPGPEGFLRVTALDCRDESQDHLVAVVLVRPPGDLHGLGPDDLAVLGAMLHGPDSEQRLPALGSGSVVARLSDLAERLGLPSAAAVAMYAAREGLYAPPKLSSALPR